MTPTSRRTSGRQSSQRTSTPTRTRRKEDNQAETPTVSGHKLWRNTWQYIPCCQCMDKWHLRKQLQSYFHQVSMVARSIHFVVRVDDWPYISFLNPLGLHLCLNPMRCETLSGKWWTGLAVLWRCCTPCATCRSVAPRRQSRCRRSIQLDLDTISASIVILISAHRVLRQATGVRVPTRLVSAFAALYQRMAKEEDVVGRSAGE